MNHIHRIIWNCRLNAWVVTHEHATPHGKASSTRRAGRGTRAILGATGGNSMAALAAMLALIGSPALGNPVNPQVVHGSASFAQTGSTLNVTNSANAIINWQSFSIGANETTRFIQPSASSAVLNRVLGKDPSQLLGQLQSNGKVFLINPAGILVGQGARIDVAGLVASTLHLSNDDFLAGKLNFTATPDAQGVVNQGQIVTGAGGTVALVGGTVTNDGLISTPLGQTVLAAGQTVQITELGNPALKIEITGRDNAATNLGQVMAEAGQIGVVGTLVRNSGTLSASSVVNDGGRVFLRASHDAYVDGNGRIVTTGSKGGQIDVLGQRVALLDNATLDASGAQGGGQVRVGGGLRGENPDVPNAQITFVGENTSINVDATKVGAGGTAIVWADDTTRAYGTISAQGGSLGGDGGFIETSGKRFLDVGQIGIDIAAPQGKGGTWLLDPDDVTISSASSSNMTGSSPFQPAAAGTSVLSDAVLRAALALGGTVIVDTSSVGTGNGDILVDSSANLASISLLTSAATLELKADRNITINSEISRTGAYGMSVSLRADQDNNNTGAITIAAPINSGSSSVTAIAYGDISLTYGGGTNINAASSSVTLTSYGGKIVGSSAGTPFDVVANTVGLVSYGGISDPSGAAFYVDASAVAFSNTGTQLVDIYHGGTGTTTFAGSTGGALTLASFSASAATIGTVNSGAGTFTGVAAGGAVGAVNLRFNNPNITNSVSASGRTVYLSPYTANSQASLGGTASFDLTGTELDLISASKIVVGKDTFGNYSSDVTIGAQSTVSLNNKNLEVASLIITVFGAYGGIANASGTLAFSADSMFINGNISTFSSGVMAGEILFQPKTTGVGIAIGSTLDSGPVGLSNTELSGVSTQVLRIGNGLGSAALTNTGNVTLSSSLVGTLYLHSGTGGITQTTTGGINAAKLAIRSLGTVDLNDSTANSATDIAAIVGDGSNQNKDFLFKGTGNLNVGANIGPSSDLITGITVSIDAVGYSTASPNGVISLTATGSGIADLTQSASALLSGKAVRASAVSVNLSQANPTGIIAGTTVSSDASNFDFAYRSVNPIVVTTVDGQNGISAVKNVKLEATSGGITLNQPVSTNCSVGSACKVILDAGNGSFVNNAGSAGLSVPALSRWLVYASAPAAVTKGGLTSDFRHYGKNSSNYFIGDPLAPLPTDITESGNGFIYQSTPSLSVATQLASGTASHTYFSNPTASFSTVLSGFTDAEDTAGNIGLGGTAAFTPVSASTHAGSFTVSYTSGLTSSAGYSFVAGSGVAYTVIPAPLTLTLNNTSVTKTYDGTSTASFTPVYTVSGLVGGDSAATLSASTLAYSSSHVGTASFVTASGLALTAITGSNGSLVGDYSIPTSASSSAATASITAKAISAAANIGGTTTKAYDGTATATGASVSGSVTGAIAGDVLSLTTGGLSLAYNSPRVTLANTIAATGSSGFNITSSTAGSLLSDYAFTQPTIASVAGSITPFTLTATASIGGTTTKVYDSTTAATGATLSAGISAGIAGDSLSLGIGGITLAYNSKHVALANTISATGSAVLSVNSSSVGSLASDYAFAQPGIASVAGTITPKALSISGITAANKVYDSTTAASINSSGAVYSGLIAGDSLVLSGVTGTFVDKNVGTGKTVNLASGYSGTDVGNYSITNQASTTANITAAPITFAAVTDTRTYDGTFQSTAAPTLSQALFTGDSISGLTQSFVSKNVLGTSGSTLSVNSGYTLNDGNGGNNYAVSLTTASGTINQRLLTLAFASADKIYDGNSLVAVLPAPTFSNAISSDLANLSASAAGLYNDINVGTKTVSYSSIALTGSAANNYSLANTTASGSGVISQLASVDWVGGTSGDWLTASNWAGGALPINNNVTTAVFSTPVSITSAQALNLGILGILANGSSFSLDVTGGLTTGSGAIQVPAGSLTLITHSPLVIGSGGLQAVNGITLNSLTADATSTITVNGAVNAGTSNLTLASYGNIAQNANMTGGAVNVTSSNGSIAIAKAALTSGSSISYAAPAGSLSYFPGNFSGAAISLSAQTLINSAPILPPSLGTEIPVEAAVTTSIDTALSISDPLEEILTDSPIEFTDSPDYISPLNPTVTAFTSTLPDGTIGGGFNEFGGNTSPNGTANDDKKNPSNESEPGRVQQCS